MFQLLCLSFQTQKNHKSLDYVVEILDMLEERRAIAVIDEMIVRKFDK